MIDVAVIIGKAGRFVLPKELREKFRVKEGSRLIIRDYGGRIILIPVMTYDEPTEALHGSVQLTRPIEKPKVVARAHIRKKLLEDLE